MLIREVLRARNRERDGALPAQRDRQRQSREKAADAACREDGDVFAVDHLQVCQVSSCSESTTL